MSYFMKNISHWDNYKGCDFRLAGTHKTDLNKKGIPLNFVHSCIAQANLIEFLQKYLYPGFQKGWVAQKWKTYWKRSFASSLSWRPPRKHRKIGTRRADWHRPGGNILKGNVCDIQDIICMPMHNSYVLYEQFGPKNFIWAKPQVFGLDWTLDQTTG